VIGFPKPRPKVLDKRDEKRDRDANERRVNAEVDARDKYRCRACGKPADPKSTDPLRRGHRHHLKFRSRGGQDSTANMLLLCAEDHALVHAYRLFIIGTDANEQLRFERVK
jgi:5-methylcytosine-specific restriction endonuclease McrA